jgi:hypothetical protein
MLNDLKTVKYELSERVITRATELHMDHDNPLAVSNIITLEELARLELRMRALAEAILAADTFLGKDTLKAIAGGQELP